MDGSTTDQLRLIDTLGGYRRAERLARQLGTAGEFVNLDQHYDALTLTALKCGFSFSLDLTVEEWAERRVALIQWLLPNHIKGAA